MIKKTVSIFFTVLFVAIISAPSIVAFADDSIDVSILYSLSEEEEETKNLKIIVSDNNEETNFLNVSLKFQNSRYHFKNYPLGEKVIYPQVKIALEIASKHNTALIHDCGFISSGFEDTFLDNKKIQNRPDDMGINERLSYLLSIKNPILIQKLAMQLAGWSIEVFEDIEKLNPKEAKKLVKSLVFSLNNVTPYFIILLFKIKKFKYGIFSLICLIAKPSFLLNYIWFLMMIVDKIFTKIKTHKKN